MRYKKTLNYFFNGLKNTGLAATDMRISMKDYYRKSKAEREENAIFTYDCSNYMMCVESLAMDMSVLSDGIEDILHRLCDQTPVEIAEHIKSLHENPEDDLTFYSIKRILFSQRVVQKGEFVGTSSLKDYGQMLKMAAAFTGKTDKEMFEALGYETKYKKLVGGEIVDTSFGESVAFDIEQIEKKKADHVEHVLHFKKIMRVNKQIIGLLSNLDDLNEDPRILNKALQLFKSLE